jgi:hypothetical protein
MQKGSEMSMGSKHDVPELGLPQEFVTDRLRGYTVLNTHSDPLKKAKIAEEKVRDAPFCPKDGTYGKAQPT